MIYLIQFVLTFVGVFFKGLQQQNIIGGKYAATALTSWVISAFVVIEVMLIADTGYWGIIPVGSGGSLGITLSMYLYRKTSKHGWIRTTMYNFRNWRDS